MSGQHRHFLRSAKAQPTFFLVLSAVIVLGAVVGLGYLVWDGPDDDPSVPAATSTAEQTASAVPSEPADDADPEPGPPEEPEPEPTPTPTPTADEPAEPSRDLAVNVYNRTSVSGLAARRADEIRAAGWTVGATTNWNGGNIPSDTVYYPEGEQAAAELLAADLGIDRVMPRVDPMPTDLLSVILVSG